jgi:MFS transporter, FSR family, fosmidomycin resistance protein
LSVPGLVGLLVEPPLGLFGDRGWRRRIVLGAGVAFALSLGALAASISFAVLLAALVILSSASGAFVGLSQAALMDASPGERQDNMARWTLVGSVGVLAGPLLLVAGLPWRPVFAGYGFVAVALVVLASRQGLDGSDDGEGFRGLLRALRTPGVVRWLLLLELEDLGGDVFYGFLALYLVDVAGADARVAALGVVAWTGADLLGNIVVVRMLGRVDGLRWLRVTAAGFAALFPLFQLVSGIGPKVALLTLLGALHSGWYPISQARLYDALPGRSGTALAVSTVTGTLGALSPLVLALLAGRIGLGAACWLVLLAPLALLVGVPRGRHRQGRSRSR